MSAEIYCPQCGSRRAPGSEKEPCPACLMQLGISAKTADAGAEEIADAGEPTLVPGRNDRVPTSGELGQQFPELEILGFVGQGGMGAVYKVRQRALDRVVALKIIIPRSAADPGFAERFAREARTLARLNHPAIVTIHDFGRRGDLYFLLMEFVDGINLRELLRKRKLPPAEALAIVPKMCEALQYAHDEGVVHRDIKPENILVDRRGLVKIADFGLAKLTGFDSLTPHLTGTRQVVGTPHYMAPEQIQNSRGVDHRADIYSLGVVFYELLTGELPVGRFEPPSRRAPVDLRLDNVVLRSLERDPDRRYQQASEVKSAVEVISQETPAASGAWSPDGASATTATPFSSVWSDFRWFWKGPQSLWRGWPALCLLVLGIVCIVLALAKSTFLERRLVAAAVAGDISLLQIWLTIGVDANARDESGDTALLRAAGEGQTGPIERLLGHGASIDLANEQGITPLLYAAWQGQDNAVAILLRNHASITRRSNDQETALHKAAFRGHAAVLKILLEAGAEIDDVDEDGETPLILAASAGHLPVVRLLLARQADPNLATRQGWTALMLAARNGHQSVVEALAPVSRVNDVAAQGETALSMALYGGHVGIIEQILKAGANESGALWLWRGIRLSRSGQNAEALPCLEKAATDRQSSGRVWNVTIDGVRYDVPAPRCLVSLALGVCHQQLNQTEEAVQAFKKGLENAPQTAGSVVLVRRVRQIPGLTETEVLEVTRDEIQRHVSDPAAAWRVQVKQNKDEQGGGRHSRSTIHSGRMVRGFF